MTIKFLKLSVATLVIVFLVGCASSKDVLRQYEHAPNTCEEIQEEIMKLANQEVSYRNIRQLLQTAPTGIGVAAATGLVPAGLGWLPLISTISPHIPIPSNTNRIWYLSYVHASKQCEPMAFDDQPNHK